MRDETLAALKAWRSSKALALDESKFKLILSDLRSIPDDELWERLSRKVKPQRVEDSALKDVKQALAKYKATASAKAAALTLFLLPVREGPAPKTMPAALKVLRGYFSDSEIVQGAHDLMASLKAELGTDVPL